MKQFILFISGHSGFCHCISYESFAKVLDILLSGKTDCTIGIAYSLCCNNLTSYIKQYCETNKIEYYGTPASMNYFSKVSVHGAILFQVDGRFGAVAKEINDKYSGPKRIIKLSSNGSI